MILNFLNFPRTIPQREFTHSAQRFGSIISKILPLAKFIHTPPISRADICRPDLHSKGHPFTHLSPGETSPVVPRIFSTLVSRDVRAGLPTYAALGRTSFVTILRIEVFIFGFDHQTHAKRRILFHHDNLKSSITSLLIDTPTIRLDSQQQPRSMGLKVRLDRNFPSQAIEN